MIARSSLWKMVVLALLTAALAGCASSGAGSEDIPVVVREVEGAFLIELTCADSPCPRAEGEEALANPYSTEIVYLEGAKEGEATEVLSRSDWREPVLSSLSFWMAFGVQYGAPDLPHNSAKLAPLEKSDHMPRDGVWLDYSLMSDNWSEEGQVRVLLPRVLPLQDGELTLSGKGRAALQLQRGDWQGELVEFELDFSKLE